MEFGEDEIDENNYLAESDEEEGLEFYDPKLEAIKNREK